VSRKTPPQSIINYASITGAAAVKMIIKATTKMIGEEQ
jgi:hypothetical protein